MVQVRYQIVGVYFVTVGGLTGIARYDRVASEHETIADAPTQLGFGRRFPSWTQRTHATSPVPARRVGRLMHVLESSLSRVLEASKYDIGVHKLERI